MILGGICQMKKRFAIVMAIMMIVSAILPVSGVSAGYYFDSFNFETDEYGTVLIDTAEELFNNCMNGNFGIALMVQTNTFDMNWLSTYYSSEYIGGLNMARYSDPELDMLLSRAAVCTDPERRTALYNEILIEAEKSAREIHHKHEQVADQSVGGVEFAHNLIGSGTCGNKP